MSRFYIVHPSPAIHFLHWADKHVRLRPFPLHAVIRRRRAAAPRHLFTPFLQLPARRESVGAALPAAPSEPSTRLLTNRSSPSPQIPVAFPSGSQLRRPRHAAHQWVREGSGAALRKHQLVAAVAEHQPLGMHTTSANGARGYRRGAHCASSWGGVPGGSRAYRLSSGCCA